MAIFYSPPSATISSSGLATSALQTTGNASLTSIDGKIPALGQALAAASTPVVLTAAQISTLTPLTSVGVNNFPASQAVTGPLTDTQLRATPVPVSGTFFQATQPVSIASMPSTPVTGTFWQATQPVSIATAPALVASSAIIGQVGIDQTTPGTTNLVSIGTNGTVAINSALPTGTNSIGNLGTVSTVTTVSAVTAITNALPSGANTIGYTLKKGFAVANAPVYNVYSSTNVTTAAYVQMVAALTAECDHLSIFDSSGQALYLAVGGAGAEVDQFIIPPGGGEFDLFIAAGSRVSLKAVTGTANTGYATISFMG